jgi:SET domain
MTMRNAVQRLVSVNTGRYVAIGGNHLGRAVFAARAFHAGAVLMRFGGHAVRGGAVPHNQAGAADRFMQVDVDSYLGPSGAVDDFVNHSCDPNCGVRFTDHGIIMVALREIVRGEEIAWDYSTTMHNNKWLMKCDCRSSICRGLIGEFRSLPAARQGYYLEQDVVATYIVRALADGEALAPARPSTPQASGLAELNRRLRKFARELVGAPYGLEA